MAKSSSVFRANARKALGSSRVDQKFGDIPGAKRVRIFRAIKKLVTTSDVKAFVFEKKLQICPCMLGHMMGVAENGRNLWYHFLDTKVLGTKRFRIRFGTKKLITIVHVRASVFEKKLQIVVMGVYSGSIRKWVISQVSFFGFESFGKRTF